MIEQIEDRVAYRTPTPGLGNPPRVGQTVPAQQTQRRDLAQQLAKDVKELKKHDDRLGDRVFRSYLNGVLRHNLMNAAIAQSTILRALGERVTDKGADTSQQVAVG